MSEISKAYEPQSVESKWYQFWLDHKCFVADPARVSEKRPAYSIVIPPPNVTGVLTLGHVLNNTIQDILARKARMDGKEVLWQPGIDHAGIATENVVTRQLRKEEHKTKHDLGREEFLKRVWTWKEKHGGIILQQLRALGASCDWARTRFTMDDNYMRCVMRVFVDLYKKGLIYRGKRMVNWCPASLTALSDEEVIMKEQKGFMYHFKVEVAEQPGTFLTIATTRPETIPGDTAVAVNPKDTRYAHLIGKHVMRPLPAELPREQKLIPIIGDEHVDFEFGTGVLKVTPAHDKADFEIHGRIVAKALLEGPGSHAFIEPIEVIRADGTMNEKAGKDLQGLDRFKARKVAAEKLAELGSLEKEEPYTNNVGFSERADVPIEPRLSEQWFLKYPGVQQAQACVALGSTGYQPVPSGNLPDGTGEAPGQQSGAASSSSTSSIPVGESPTGTGGSPVLPVGAMKFYPERWAKVYDHWMTGIQDWCISRQLWWGHRIPVWIHRSNPNAAIPDFLPNKLLLELKSVGQKGGKEVSLSAKLGNSTFLRYEEIYRDDLELTIYAATTSSEEAKLLEENGFTQDPDVLDTWFSSWLWPFATMGWTGNPEIDAQNDTLKKFYPTTDLVTGPDIIFFWVARMIMAGYEYMGEMPFRNVYFTGIIRDKLGRKMSKSLGNSPDPLDLIGKYGADALRFGVMRAAPLGQDILFDEQNVELGRNFCNKLWNACRFRQMQGGEAEGEIRPELLTSDDKWILLKLDAAIREVTDALNSYKFNEATNVLYRFFWSEYCDWYVEATKAVLGQAAPPSSPSPLNGERAGVRGGSDHDASTAAGSPHLTQPSSPLRGGDGDARAAARRANTLAVIDFVLSHTLRLFHPFLPFITEELWQGMGFNDDLPIGQGGETIMFANWPKPLDQDFKDSYGIDDCYLERVEAKYELVRQGRNLRREGNIAGNKKVRFVLRPLNDLAPHDSAVLKILLNAEQFEINPGFEPQKGTLRAVSTLGELFLPLEGLRDETAERARLEKELAKIDAEIEKVAQKLANPSFTQKVPPNVLLEHQQRLVDWKAKRQQIQAALDSLQS